MSEGDLPALDDHRTEGDEAPISLGVPDLLAPGPQRRPPIRVGPAFRLLSETDHGQRSWLLASLLSLIPILGPLVVAGWLGEAHRRLIAHHPEPLPALSLKDIKRHAREGWSSWLLGSLGAVGLVLAGYLSFVLANILGLTLSLALGDGSVYFIVMAISGLSSLLGLLYWAVWQSAALTRTDLGASWRASWSQQASEYRRQTARMTLWAALRFLPAAGLCLTVGVMLCGLGALPALVLVQVAAMHLRWQIFETHRARFAASEVPNSRHLAAAPTELAGDRARAALPPGSSVSKTTSRERERVRR